MATIIRLAKSTIHVRKVTEQFANHPAFDRGEQITNFSRSSAYRLTRYLRFCSSRYRTFITLTYPARYPGSGYVCKAHLKEFLRREYRRNSYDKGMPAFSAVWFMEFQKRGAPHFHVYQTTPVAGFEELQAMRRRVADSWFDICATGDPKHHRAGTNVQIFKERGHVIAYAAKYASKSEQKDVPAGFLNCGRFWGIVGDREVMAASIIVPNKAHRERGVYDKILSLVSWAISEEKAGNVAVHRNKMGSITRIIPKNEYGEVEIRRKYWVFCAHLTLNEGIKTEMSGILGASVDEEVRIYSELAG